MNTIGVDVDSKFLVCQITRGDNNPIDAQFDNSASGFRKFIRWALKGAQKAKVCMESTGVYSIPFALALHEDTSIRVAVVNPRAMKRFGEAILQRGKTDKMDASTIREYAIRMPWRDWSPPSQDILEIQLICRRIVQLNTEHTRENNRRKAALRLGQIGKIVVNDAGVNMRHIQRRMSILEKTVLKLISQIPELQSKLDILCSTTGIAHKTGSRILAEIMALPEQMSASQWVAHAGLDPKPIESGTSTKAPRRISKAGNRYLRAALYFPALVACTRDRNVRAYYAKLIEAGKRPLQAIVAVMRKLLLAIWGMFKHKQNWDGDKFYKIPIEA